MMKKSSINPRRSSRFSVKSDENNNNSNTNNNNNKQNKKLDQSTKKIDIFDLE